MRAESKEKLSQHLLSWLSARNTPTLTRHTHRSLSGFVPVPALILGPPYQWIWSEAVGEHHSLTECLVLIILLGELSRTIDAKTSSIHSSSSPVWKEGTKT